MLLQEIHHRVKNNLNIVVSLLNLQAEHIKDVTDAKRSIKVSCDRIYSMALVHEKLYQSENIAFIDIESYADTILDELIAIYGAHLELDLDLQIDAIELKITQAVPCGLILNELITNSLIHAFPDRTKGRIAIHFHSLDDSRYQLIYQDDGIGFDGGEVITDDLESLGLRLIQILSEQLGGDPVFEGRGGFRFQLVIEK